MCISRVCWVVIYSSSNSKCFSCPCAGVDPLVDWLSDHLFLLVTHRLDLNIQPWKCENSGSGWYFKLWSWKYNYRDISLYKSPWCVSIESFVTSWAWQHPNSFLDFEANSGLTAQWILMQLQSFAWNCYNVIPNIESENAKNQASYCSKATLMSSLSAAK